MTVTDFKRRFGNSVAFRRQAIFSALDACADLIGAGAAFAPYNDLAFYALWHEFRGHESSNKHKSYALYYTFLRPWLDDPSLWGTTDQTARQALEPNPYLFDAVHHDNPQYPARQNLANLNRTQVALNIRTGNVIKQSWRKKPFGGAVIALSSVGRQVSGLGTAYERAVAPMWQREGSVPMWLANEPTLVSPSRFEGIASHPKVSGWFEGLSSLQDESNGGFDLPMAGLTTQ